MLNKVKKLFQIPETRYTSKEIFRWLWIAWRGNRKQAILNALIGILSVVVSLATVWAVQHAIDVALMPEKAASMWQWALWGL